MENSEKKTLNKHRVLRLQNELLSFCDYIKPTETEKKVRNIVVKRIKSVILEKWPSAMVQVFGSFATELYLPKSDIDIVVLNAPSTALYAVDSLLRCNGIATQTQIIAKAIVPIIKFVDNETGINVDISFNNLTGVNSICKIVEHMNEYPGLKQLYLALKQFILQNDLNEVFTGGIGSYHLLLMCVSFMKYLRREFIINKNVGILLIQFFSHYNECFNDLSGGIAWDSLFMLRPILDARQMSITDIQEPMDYAHFLASKSRRFSAIRTAFSTAYEDLYRDLVSRGESSRDSLHLDDGPILFSLISADPAMRQFRANIREKFEPSKRVRKGELRASEARQERSEHRTRRSSAVVPVSLSCTAVIREHRR